MLMRDDKSDTVKGSVGGESRLERSVNKQGDGHAPLVPGYTSGLSAAIFR